MSNQKSGSMDLANPGFQGNVAGSTGQSPIVANQNGDAGAAIFNGLSAKLGGWRDEAAQMEGDKAGKLAGLDPNYRPMGDITIRGKAFEQSGTETYYANLQTKSLNAINDVHEQFRQLPADQQLPSVLKDNLAKTQKELNKDVFPEIQARFQNDFTRASTPYLRQASDDLFKRTQNGVKAASDNELQAISNDAHRKATLTDENADAATAQGQSQFAATVRTKVARGDYSATDGEKLIRNNQQSLLKTRILSQYEAAPDDQKPKILENFKKQYGEGTGFSSDASASGATLGPNAPAGMRNNNPGNIKYVGQKDAVGPSSNTDQGDPQAVYATPEAGMSAAYQLALRKYNAGKTSANDLIAGQGGWTPGNKSAATNIARGMGLSADDDLQLSNPDNAQKFMRSLLMQEHGPASRAYSDTMIANAVGAKNVTRGIDNDTYDWLTGKMETGIRTIGIQAKQQERVALGEIAEAQKQIKSGYDLPQQDWNALTTKHTNNPSANVQQELQTTTQIRSLFAGFKGQRPETIEAQIANAEAEGAKGGMTPQRKEIFDAAKQYANTLRDDLNKDPITRAAHDGVISGVAPIDVMHPDKLAATLALRKSQAEHAAEYYQQSPRYLMPDERAAFKSLAAQGGPQMIQAAGVVASTFGAQASKVLDEIGGEAPKFAAAARLSAWNASPGFLADFGERQRLNNDPTTRGALEMPSQNRSDQIFGSVYGNSMAAIPQMHAAARGAAKEVYEVRALRDGLDKGVNTAQAEPALRRAAQEAAGATFDGDTQYGGVGVFNRGYWAGSQKVLAPLNMKADMVGKAVQSLNDTDLAGQAVKADLKTPVTASALKNSFLTSIGHGMYQVSMNDPADKDPQYVLQPNGQKYILDLNKHEAALRFRAPDLYKGGH